MGRGLRAAGACRSRRLVARLRGLLAAGELRPDAVARGHTAVQTLKREMAAGRKARLTRLGFGAAEAERLAELHTRNFM